MLMGNGRRGGNDNAVAGMGWYVMERKMVLGAMQEGRGLARWG